MNAQLKLKKDADGSDGASTCPSCGTNLAEGAVICVQCGFDVRSGRRLDVDDGAGRQIPWGGMALTAVLLAAGAAGYLYLKKDTLPTPPPVTQSPAPAPAAVEAPAAAAAAAASDEPAAEVTSQPTPEVVATNVVEQTPAQEQAAPVTNAEPEKPVVDRAGLEQTQRAILSDQLNLRLPLFKSGETVALRLTNGIVKRGELINIGQEIVVLSISTNDKTEVPFESLDRETRVRCDPYYRERFLEFHVQQKVNELIQNAESGAATP